MDLGVGKKMGLLNSALRLGNDAGAAKVSAGGSIYGHRPSLQTIWSMLAVKTLFAMPVWSGRVVKALQYIEIPRLAIQISIRKQH